MVIPILITNGSKKNNNRTKKKLDKILLTLLFRV